MGSCDLGWARLESMQSLHSCHHARRASVGKKYYSCATSARPAALLLGTCCAQKSEQVGVALFHFAAVLGMSTDVLLAAINKSIPTAVGLAGARAWFLSGGLDTAMCYRPVGH